MLAQVMLGKRFGGSAQFTVGRFRYSPVRMLAGKDYRRNPLDWVFIKWFRGLALINVGLVRFSPVPVIPGTGYRKNKLVSVLSKTFGGPAPFTVGRVRFSPFRLVQAPATAHDSSFHAR